VLEEVTAEESETNAGAFVEAKVEGAAVALVAATVEEVEVITSAAAT
jgi:hypothetical protein